jgi:hypothetical protein
LLCILKARRDESEAERVRTRTNNVLGERFDKHYDAASMKKM